MNPLPISMYLPHRLTAFTARVNFPFLQSADRDVLPRPPTPQGATPRVEAAAAPDRSSEVHFFAYR